MIEHRLIERMIALLEERAARAQREVDIDGRLIEASVDFIRTYADRTHHGKEEDILFEALATRDLSPDHRGVMEDLVDEHVRARELVADLVAAQERFRHGNTEALSEIVQRIDDLVGLYPGHIEKEDKVFFPAAMDYFDPSEQEAMLERMWRFDRQMIHEKYQTVVDRWEEGAG
jgi:hemerythrin-like domain-containing protein